MKKRVLISCVLMSLVMMISCIMTLGVSAATGTVTMTEVHGGTAIGGKVVTISTADELYKLRDYVAAGKPTEGVTFRLEQDIALPSSRLFGTQTAQYSNSPDIGTAADPFEGLFDGNGKKISNLIIAERAYSAPNALGTEDLEGRGVFAYTDGATIQNLTVVVAGVSYAELNIGGIVGCAKNTTLTHCGAEGTVTKNAKNTRLQKNVGGLIGLADACTVRYCYAEVKITGLENVGGLVGYAKNGTKLLFATSKSTIGFDNQKQDPATAPVNFGGIVGKLEGSTVENAFVNGTTLYAKSKTTDADMVGGVAGAMDATSSITNALVKVTVTKGDGVTCDPVVGDAKGTVQRVYASSVSAVAGVVTFNGSFTLASQVNVNGKLVDHAFAAANLYITQKQATYPEQNLYFNAFATVAKDGLVQCPSHTRPDDAPACESTYCATCFFPMEATANHSRPTDVGACKEDVKCRYCKNVVVPPAASHTRPDVPACQEGVSCSVCEKALETTANHEWNNRSNYCEEDQYCVNCQKVQQKAPGHLWTKKNCDKDQVCTVCGKTGELATGLHIPDREAPTCTDPVKCTVCTSILKDENGKLMEALGHDESGKDPDCGHGKRCLRCGKMLQDATGEHTVDWTKATVVREPAPDVNGLIEAACSVCGKVQRQYPRYEAPGEGSGQGSADAGLPTGALIGIIAGAVVVVGGGVAAIVIVLSKKKKKGAALDTDNADE